MLGQVVLLNIMRIIAGIARGHPLIGPKSARIRPVLDQVKEAIFNILGPMTDLTVLDLFAGTGSLGFEALSRGAKQIIFVDNFVEALRLLRKNAEKLGFENQIKIMRGFLPRAVKSLAGFDTAFDLIFVDPPYDRDLVAPTLQALRHALRAQHKLVDRHSRIIIEHSPREPALGEGFIVADERVYGQTRITILKIP